MWLLLFCSGGPHGVGDPQHFYMQSTLVQYMRELQMCLGSSAQVWKSATRMLAGRPQPAESIGPSGDCAKIEVGDVWVTGMEIKS